MEEKQQNETNENLAVCPQCNQKSLRMENGCHSCINPDCGWSKCDM